MKKKLSAFIIGAAIWFGMADAARQMDYLKSEASDFVAKSSIYLFSFGRENAPAQTEGYAVEPLYALSNENALADKTKTRTVYFNDTFARINAKSKQEKMGLSNHSDEKLPDENEFKIRVGDLNVLTALSDKLEAEVHSQIELNRGVTASLLSLKDIEIEQREFSLKKIALVEQKAADSGRRYDGKFTFEIEFKPSIAPKPVKVQKTPCPSTVSPDKGKLKTVLLLPEVLRQFGE